MKHTRQFSFIIMIMSMTSVSYAADIVDKQLATATSTHIDIKVQQGNVDIATWDKNEVSVIGQLDELSEGLLFEQQGNRIVIEDKLPRNYSSQHNQGSKLTIKIPQRMDLSVNGVSANYQLARLTGQVQINTVSGDLTLALLDGKQVYKTVSGDIHSQQLKGDVKLTTVSGNIVDSDSQGRIHYVLVSGDLNAISHAQNVHAETVSGNGQLTLDHATDIEIKSVSGDNTLKLSAKVNSLSADSVSGDINLIFTDIPSANISLDGGPGGKILNTLTDDTPIKQQYSPSQTMTFQTGTADGQFTLSTISGTLRLDKQ